MILCLFSFYCNCKNYNTFCRDKSSERTNCFICDYFEFTQKSDNFEKQSPQESQSSKCIIYYVFVLKTVQLQIVCNRKKKQMAIAPQTMAFLFTILFFCCCNLMQILNLKCRHIVVQLHYKLIYHHILFFVFGICFLFHLLGMKNYPKKKKPKKKKKYCTT